MITRIYGPDGWQTAEDPIEVVFDFTVDTPGIADGVAVPGYLPRAGDLILPATLVWPRVTWNEVTIADIFLGAATSGVMNLVAGGPANLATPPYDPAGGVSAPLGGYWYGAALTEDADALYVAAYIGSRGTPSDATEGTARLYLSVKRLPS